jgi:hypothetical protein
METDVKMPTRRSFRRAGGLLLAGAAACGAGGCFNLGGRTTYVQQSPETDARLRALETRVGALEQAFTTRAATPPLPQSALPLIGQSNSASSYLSDDQAGGASAIR